MGLLNELQTSVLDADSEIAPILLKLRFLASKLDSEPLEEWVKFESEGYPEETEIPEYRKLSVTYMGTFAGPMGASYSNVPIPSSLISKYASDRWLEFQERSSISVIDQVVKNQSESGRLQTTNAANLALALQGKVFPDYSCVSVTGLLSMSSMAAIQHAVRARVLELTIGLEKAVPSVGEIVVSEKTDPIDKSASAKVTEITLQTIYGDHVEIKNSGHGAQFNVNVNKGDVSAFRKALENEGIHEDDASALAEIVRSEEPMSSDEPLGKKAQSWLAKNLSKALDGTWAIGVGSATALVTEAAMRFYGYRS